MTNSMAPNHDSPNCLRDTRYKFRRGCHDSAYVGTWIRQVHIISKQTCFLFTVSNLHVFLLYYILHYIMF